MTSEIVAPATGPVTPFAYSAVFESPLDLHLAFFRDVTADVDFILKQFAACGRSAHTAIEVQCGPAYYAKALAERGLRCTAIDSRADFVAFASTLCAPADIHFAVEHPCRLGSHAKADIVLLPLDSFAYFQSDADIHAFLTGAARLMHEDSILIIEANHPKDVGYIDYGVVYGGTAPGYPGRQVRAEWGVNAPRFDLLTGRVDTVIRITRRDGDGESMRDVPSQEYVHFPRELMLLTQQSPLTITSFHGGYADHELGWDDAVQVMVLRKRPQ